MDRESVKKVSVDSFNKPILSPVKKILCQYSGPPLYCTSESNAPARLKSTDCNPVVRLMVARFLCNNRLSIIFAGSLRFYALPLIQNVKPGGGFQKS